MDHRFIEWSPAQLAHVLGYRINLVANRCGTRTAYFERGARRHPMSHEHACAALSRLARMRSIDPDKRPDSHPRALIEGIEQEDGLRAARK